MGLFGALFGSGSRSTVQTADDKIWRSREARFKGLAKQLGESSDSAVILLIAHFDDTLAELAGVVENYSGDIPLKAALAENLSEDVAATLDLDEKATIDLIVAERHPLLSADEAIAQFAEKIPCRCRVSYHVSLEDPLLKVFVSGFVQKILDTFGMTDDEPIDSQMVTRRVKEAQKKVASTATGDSRAASAEQWLEINTPGT